MTRWLRVRFPAGPGLSSISLSRILFPRLRSSEPRLLPSLGPIRSHTFYDRDDLCSGPPRRESSGPCLSPQTSPKGWTVVMRSQKNLPVVWDMDVPPHNPIDHGTVRGLESVWRTPNTGWGGKWRTRSQRTRHFTFKIIIGGVSQQYSWRDVYMYIVTLVTDVSHSRCLVTENNNTNNNEHNNDEKSRDFLPYPDLLKFPERKGRTRQWPLRGNDTPEPVPGTGETRRSRIEDSLHDPQFGTLGLRYFIPILLRISPQVNTDVGEDPYDLKE